VKTGSCHACFISETTKWIVMTFSIWTVHQMLPGLFNFGSFWSIVMPYFT